MDTTAEARLQSALAEMSREMVRLYKEQFGRRPKKTHSSFSDPDTLVCTLESSLTPVERYTVTMGGEPRRAGDAVVHLPFRTQKAFVEAAETIFKRKVRTFTSRVDVVKDVATEVFYFEPDPTD